MERKPYKYSKEVLSDAVKDVYSYAQLIEKFGRRKSGGLQYHLKKLIDLYGIDISHFKGQGWNKGGNAVNKHDKDSFIKIVLVVNSGWNSHKIKLRLIELGIKNHRCEECRLDEWNNKPIPIELDHINGDHNDNRLVNLRILCPNCHAQTETYCKKK